MEIRENPGQRKIRQRRCSTRGITTEWIPYTVHRSNSTVTSMAGRTLVQREPGGEMCARGRRLCHCPRGASSQLPSKFLTLSAGNGGSHDYSSGTPDRFPLPAGGYGLLLPITASRHPWPRRTTRVRRNFARAVSRAAIRRRGSKYPVHALGRAHRVRRCCQDRRAARALASGALQFLRLNAPAPTRSSAPSWPPVP